VAADSPNFAGQRELLFRRRLASAGMRYAVEGDKREREQAQGDRRWTRRESIEIEAPFARTSLRALRGFHYALREFNHV
jgi:hypothetical protein